MHFHTRALRHIRPELSDCMATTLATSLVQSRLDYANYLMYGTSAANIHKLQCPQNSLSRVALSGRHREHLSASMRLSNLYWLPVRKRIDFKLAMPIHLYPVASVFDDGVGDGAVVDLTVGLSNGRRPARCRARH